MRYVEAKKLHKGDEVFCKYNGLTYYVIDIKVDTENKEVYVLCDDENYRHHTVLK